MLRVLRNTFTFTFPGIALVVVVAVGGPSCLATLNGVVFEPAADAPVVEPRADGCSVEIFEDGGPPARPNKKIGHLQMVWSPEQMSTQGHDGALKSLASAACVRGAHLVLGLRVLPRTPDPGVVYDGDLAVLLDDNGQPYKPKSMATPPTPAPAKQ